MQGSHAARQEGQCRCGAVRFAVAGAPLMTFACHCTGCQRMSASAFSLSSLYPTRAFQLLQGETMLGGMRGATRHHFCPSCMSWLYTQPEGLDDFVNIRSSLLDDPSGHRPFIETFRKEGLPWVVSGAVKSYETSPADDEFGELMGAYARWDGGVRA